MLSSVALLLIDCIFYITNTFLCLDIAQNTILSIDLDKLIMAAFAVASKGCTAALSSSCKRIE